LDVVQAHAPCGHRNVVLDRFCLPPPLPGQALILGEFLIRGIERPLPSARVRVGPGRCDGRRCAPCCFLFGGLAIRSRLTLGSVLGCTHPRTFLTLPARVVAQLRCRSRFCVTPCARGGARRRALFAFRCFRCLLALFARPTTVVGRIAARPEAILCVRLPGQALHGTPLFGCFVVEANVRKHFWPPQHMNLQ
jgi:hypothetical protein